MNLKECIKKTIREFMLENKMNEKTSALKKAQIIGIIAICTYLANYFSRNMLTVLTPFMSKGGLYAKEYLAMLASVYMVVYAAGQLFNGVLGDIIKPRYMVLCGLLAAGGSLIAFPFCPQGIMQILCFGILGYALSMTRGPLMKTISENTERSHARVIGVFFSFSSFAGPMIASLIAFVFEWNMAFVVAGTTTALIATISYIVLTVLEKMGLISYKKMETKNLKGILEVFKIESFAFYMIIACLVEIAAASISFWIPTFLTEYVHFNEDKSNLVFSVISLCRSVMPFVSLTIFKLLGEKTVPIMRGAYLVSAISFLIVRVLPTGTITVVFLVLALIPNSLVSSLLWSIYIPGLGKTGRVSSVNGVLDCTGYIAASIATSASAWVIRFFGWNGLIVLWMLIAVTGILVTFFAKNVKE